MSSVAEFEGRLIFYTERVEFEGLFIRARHDAIVSDVLLGKYNE